MDDPQRRDEEAGGGGLPSWVKISLLVVALLVTVFVVLNLTGVGEHSPTRHVPRMHG